MNSSSTELDPPDDKRVGDWRLRKDKYSLVQGGLRKLHAGLVKWNTVATMSGARKGPYDEELQKLSVMIEWAEARLAEPNTTHIHVKGITVDSLRLIKAGLLLSLHDFKADLDSEPKSSWPSRVREPLLERAAEMQALADSIYFQPAEALRDLVPEITPSSPTSETPDWDVFLSHASEDKGALVDGLAQALGESNLKVWYDSFELKLGDSLRRSIDRGLASSRFGVVVLSPAFFAKEWPQRELDGLVSRETRGQKVVLPIWHNVDFDYIVRYSPTLADRLGISSSRGIVDIVEAILAVVKR